jgi:NTE family protein
LDAVGCEVDRRGFALPQLEPSADVGRVGLALSGGGLRASMYHTGVLLQLARHGVLRRVEVISTVSGGSIVGALLYLRLRELLASDEKITDAHYVNLVVEMHGELRALARKNLRTRAFANPWAILKMASPYYSRSERIGELYDQSLFTKHHPAGADAKGHVRLRDMAMDWTANAERDAKIPVLLLNTTALNTGHNFRFGPRTMGEPPAETPTALDVDKGPRLLHPENYGQLPRKLADFKLGRAVAASTCVPGLFFPVPVSGMYQGLKLQLVDGGVHDNQGIQGLLDDPEFACDTVVVSDGSGQMDCKPYPATDAVHVLSRANTVLMQRVRAEQMLNADLRARSIAVHLRSGLGVEYHYPTRADKTPGIIEHPSDTVEHGGIVFSAEVQRRLAHVRTDLDSFTDLEICTLGLLGYASTADCLSELNPTETVPENDDWWIFRATPAVTQPTRRQRRQLRAASRGVHQRVEMVA